MDSTDCYGAHAENQLETQKVCLFHSYMISVGCKADGRVVT